MIPKAKISRCAESLPNLIRCDGAKSSMREWPEKEHSALPLNCSLLRLRYAKLCRVDRAPKYCQFLSGRKDIWRELEDDELCEEEEKVMEGRRKRLE